MPTFDGDDAFGERMKFFERFETDRRFIPLLPIYARLDGRGFHKFTKGLRRPFDERLSDIMIATTKYLVSETHAKIGYTQSDEISLVWKANDFKSSVFFDGKVQKMNSVLASMTTAAFIKELLDSELSHLVDRMPHFDCRVMTFPTEMEATNMFLWRTADAVKNAVSMAARAYFSHKELHKKSGAEMQEMLFQKGINFNNYPIFFKQGTFVRRVVELRPLSEKAISQLQAAGKDVDVSQLHERAVVKEIDMPIFSKVTNRVGVIFNGEEPV